MTRRSKIPSSLLDAIWVKNDLPRVYMTDEQTEHMVLNSLTLYLKSSYTERKSFYVHRRKQDHYPPTLRRIGQSRKGGGVG
ncbi:MAG: hypothetical protein NVS4B1_30360 [Ktedonobacteraceae bacterium]